MYAYLGRAQEIELLYFDVVPVVRFGPEIKINEWNRYNEGCCWPLCTQPYLRVYRTALYLFCGERIGTMKSIESKL